MKKPKIPQSVTEQHRNIPKIISFAPHPVDQDVSEFHKERKPRMDDNHSLCPIPKSVAQDKNLSLKAKGLYWLIENYMESPTFDSSHLKPVLMANCKESSAAFDSAWKELKQAGYLIQHRIPPSNGGNKGFHYEYELTEPADSSTSPLQSAKRGGTE